MAIKEGYYIGIDVGTGSARACLIDHHGEIVDVASENIGLWQPEQDYYVCSAPQFKFLYPFSCFSSGRNNQLRTFGVVSAR